MTSEGAKLPDPTAVIQTEVQRIHDHISQANNLVGLLLAAKQSTVLAQVKAIEKEMKSTERGLEEIKCQLTSSVRLVLKRRIRDVFERLTKLNSKAKTETERAKEPARDEEAGTEQPLTTADIHSEPEEYQYPESGGGSPAFTIGHGGYEPSEFSFAEGDDRAWMREGYRTEESEGVPFDPSVVLSSTASSSMLASRRAHEDNTHETTERALTGPISFSEFKDRYMMGVQRAYESEEVPFDPSVVESSAASSSMPASRRTHPESVQERTSRDRSKEPKQVGTPSTGSLAITPVMPYMEVMVNVAREKLVDAAQIVNGDVVRTGSAPSFFIAEAFLSNRKDHKYVVPHSQYIKGYEVQDLGGYLDHTGHLSPRGCCPPVERLMYLIVLLEEGCRFEVVATYFSRTPNEVVDTCVDVAKGLLEVYEEMELPGSENATRRKYVYEHCWRIVSRYDEALYVQYYPWSFDELCKMLVTLNVLVGRLRRQGRFALDGSVFNWGKYHKEKGSPAATPGPAGSQQPGRRQLSSDVGKAGDAESSVAASSLGLSPPPRKYRSHDPTKSSATL